MTTETVKQRVSLRPFTIEVDTAGGDLVVKNIAGCKLRTAVDGHRGRLNKKTGQMTISRDRAAALASLPRIPGQYLHVNPEKLTYKITDPLADKDSTLASLKQWYNENTPFRIPAGVSMEAAPEQQGELNVHEMKSLCREIIHMMNADLVRVVQGPKPDMEDVQELPGKFLLNPGLQSHTTQPQFEEDWDAWVDNLNRGGG